jgi:hypothetical protein
MGKIYTSDVGTVFDLDVGEDVSSATTLQIVVQKPTGSPVTWAATLVGTSVLRYTATGSDLNVAGVWAMQARVVTPVGTWLGETVKFRVYASFA